MTAIVPIDMQRAAEEHLGFGSTAARSATR